MNMSYITKIGKSTYWCDECEVYLLSEATVLQHARMHLSGIEKHWLEQKQDDSDYDSELMKRIGIRWP